MKIAKNQNWEIKADTTESQPHVILEVEKTTKSYIRM